MRITQGQAAERGLAPKPQKYRNRKCEWGGRKFDSQKERDRYLVLNQLQIQGRISDLRCQVRYRLDVGGQHICDYIADFVYWRGGVGGNEVIEDVKSAATRKLPVYRIKRKLMMAIFGKEIIEV